MHTKTVSSVSPYELAEFNQPELFIQETGRMITHDLIRHFAPLIAKSIKLLPYQEPEVGPMSSMGWPFTNTVGIQLEALIKFGDEIPELYLKLCEVGAAIDYNKSREALELLTQFAKLLFGESPYAELMGKERAREAVQRLKELDIEGEETTKLSIERAKRYV